jgi:ABC-2 type transport system ATP-binding protein
MTAIAVRGLVKRYRTGAVNAVDDVSFEVPDGHFFCLLGPNGAGKTTIFSILTTTLRPTAGRVRIAGHDVVTQQVAVRRELGVVFQQPSLDMNLTAEENLRLHAVLYGLYPWRPLYSMMPSAYRRQIQGLADVVGLGDFLGRRTRTLSGGTKRKLEIVRALMHRPPVLFLDEPTAGLDPESRRDLWTYLRRIQTSSGTTIFLTTHYLDEAESADTVCVLSRGRVIERDSPARVKARHHRTELLLDAEDRVALRGELAALGLAVHGAAPLRVVLNGRTAQHVIASLTCELTRLRIVEPTLEDTYLMLLERHER